MSRIVVNGIILGRAEVFVSKNVVVRSFLDAIGMGIGFTLALAIIGAVREILGTGSLFGFALTEPILLFILPAGAFITMGLIFGGLNYLFALKEVKHG